MGLTQRPLGIIAATQAEAMLVRRRMRLQSVAAPAAGTTWHGSLYDMRVVLLRCGMGPQRAAAAASWLLDAYPLTGLLIVGFAGSVHPLMATGDAIIARRISAGWAAAATTIEPHAGWARLAVRAAEQAALRVHYGELMSLPDVVADAEAKGRIAQQAQVRAVDMESYSIGCLALAHQVPFMVLRTIFDTSGDSIAPQISQCMRADGRLHVGRLIGAMVQRPRLLPETLRLWRKTGRARRSLDRWLGCFVTLLGREDPRSSSA